MPRIKLSEQYHVEREELCKKLIEIVGTEFLLCELDENVEKQASILAMKDEIQSTRIVRQIRRVLKARRQSAIFNYFR
jgi:hypothetical protein